MLALLALLALVGVCNKAVAFALTPRRLLAPTATARATERGVSLRATSQTGGNWSEESSIMPHDVASLILNDSTPLETRRVLLSMQTALTASAMQTALTASTMQTELTASAMKWQQSLAESQIALMKAQEQERELQRLLREAITRNAAMNPRAVIEYVELFVMPRDATYIKTKDRRVKWESFLTDDTTSGPSIVHCLREDVPMWNTPAKAAAQISSLYSYTSEGAHVTSHEIADSPSTPVRIDVGPSLLLQGANAMLCIGKVLGIGIQLIRK
jgi:hypothetical protein